MNPAVLGSVSLPVRKPIRRAIRYVLDNVNKGPFLAIHLAVLFVFFVPVTWPALALFAVTYAFRIFALTGAYHRYFSHRAYKTSRVFQFILGALGCSAMQRGPLWWAANHRNHHKHSDQEDDPHSPVRHGVWWSHIGWVLSAREEPVGNEDIRDFSRYPELRLLEQFHWVPVVILAGLCYAIAGASGLVWGFVISTVLVYHCTFCVNSVCHVFGTRRYATQDFSRNNWWVALLTFGEGWHNNHHHYMSSANQGFKWWEIDISYYTLKALSLVGLVWDLRRVPKRKLPANM